MISTVSDAVRLFRPMPVPARTGLGLAAALIIALATWTGAAKAQDCANEDAVKSTQAGTAPVALSFRNASTERRRIYWLDQNGERKFYGIVEPQHILQQPSYPGFAWVVTNDAEQCLSIVTATNTAMTVDIGGPASAQLAPPLPGQQEIISQAQPAVVAEQVPPAPQVSPIEQFQLSGDYRLVPADDPHKALNNESSGRTEITRVKPQWDSAKWSFEEVPGSPYVRIENDWKHTYLVDDDGKLRARATAPEAEESQWSFEPVDGTTFVQLRNAKTERYLLTWDGAPVLAEHVPEKHENRSHWDVVSTSQPAVVSAVSNEYAAAVAGCRAIGGYWTGSSCRAAGPQRLACPRGWRWLPAADACVWAGRGACPPWQMHRGRCLTQADLTCRGGVVRLSGRGLSCHCPPGMAAWGNYPHLKCVPSLARIVPLLLQGKLGGGNGPGKQFGNKGPGNKPGKFGGKQQFGNQQAGGGKGQNKSSGNNGPATVTTVTPPQFGGNKGPANATNITPPPQTATGIATLDQAIGQLKNAKTTTAIDRKTGVKTTTLTGIDPQTGRPANIITTIDPKTGLKTTTVTATDRNTGNAAKIVTTVNAKTGVKTQSVTSIDPKTGKGAMTKKSVDPRTGTTNLVEGVIENGKVTTSDGFTEVKDPKTGLITRKSFINASGKPITPPGLQPPPPPPPVVKQTTAPPPPPPIIKQVRTPSGQNGQTVKQTTVPPNNAAALKAQQDAVAKAAALKAQQDAAAKAAQLKAKQGAAAAALKAQQQAAAAAAAAKAAADAKAKGDANAKAAALKAQQDAIAKAKAAQQAAAAKAAQIKAQQDAIAKAKAAQQAAAAKAAQAAAIAKAKAAQAAAIAKAKAQQQAAAKAAQQAAAAKAARIKAQQAAAAKAAQAKAAAIAKAKAAQAAAIAKAKAAQAAALARARAAAQAAAKAKAAQAQAAQKKIVCPAGKRLVNGHCQ
jgi:hypothetical protein